MKVKTAEATGKVLDWLVAKAEGRKPSAYGGVVRATAHPNFPNSPPMYGPEMKYSTDWAQGGPIIDREEIMFHAGEARGTLRAYLRRTGYGLPGCSWAGPTHLVAALRCYVISELGEEVDVPEELL